MAQLKVGDRVRWNSSGGESVGEIEQILTETIYIKNHKVVATPTEPQYLVRSYKSNNPAAHKASALTKM